MLGGGTKGRHWPTLEKSLPLDILKLGLFKRHAAVVRQAKSEKHQNWKTIKELYIY